MRRQADPRGAGEVDPRQDGAAVLAGPDGAPHLDSVRGDRRTRRRPCSSTCSTARRRWSAPSTTPSRALARGGSGLLRPQALPVGDGAAAAAGQVPDDPGPLQQGRQALAPRRPGRAVGRDEYNAVEVEVPTQTPDPGSPSPPPGWRSSPAATARCWRGAGWWTGRRSAWSISAPRGGVDGGPDPARERRGTTSWCSTRARARRRCWSGQLRLARRRTSPGPGCPRGRAEPGGAGSEGFCHILLNSNFALEPTAPTSRRHSVPPGEHRLDSGRRRAGGQGGGGSSGTSTPTSPQ